MLKVTSDPKLKQEVFSKGFDWTFAEANKVKRINDDEIKLVTCYYPNMYSERWNSRIAIQKNRDNRYYMICQASDRNFPCHSLKVYKLYNIKLNFDYKYEWQFEIPRIVWDLLENILSQ